MARYLWWSFVGTIASDAEELAQEPSRPLNHTVGDELLTHKGEKEVNLGLAFKAALEHKRICCGGSWAGKWWQLGEIVIVPLQDLTSQIAVQKSAPALNPINRIPHILCHKTQVWKILEVTYCKMPNYTKTPQ